MTFKELLAKYPMLKAQDSSEHRIRTDQTAAHEIWHNLLSYRGYKFASHVHEYLYDDGTSKLFIMYSSLPRQQFDEYLKEDSFMGDFVRGLNQIYPDLDHVLGNKLQRLDTEENLAKFDEIMQHIKTLPAINTKVKVAKEEELASDGDDE